MKRLFYFICIIFIMQGFFLNTKAYSAFEKVNLGVYGGQVMDITAYDNGGSTEILIGLDSITGAYRWNTASSSVWEKITYPSIIGKVHQIEANQASGYEDDIYAIVTDSATGASAVYASDSGGISGSWASISTSISNPGVLLEHSTGMYIGTNSGELYRNTGGVSNSFSLLYSFGLTDEITSISVYDANTIFVTVRTGGITTTVYKLTSSGSSFSATSLTLPSSPPSGSGSVEVHLVGVDPDDVNTIFLAGSSANPQVYKSTDGGTSWGTSWDYESSGSSNFPGGYPQYIKFNNDRVFISASVLDGTSTTWSHAPTLSSTVGTSTITTHVNDGALEVDPLDSTKIYMATDWAIGELTYTTGSWTAGSEIGNNEGIEGVVLNDIDFYEYSSTDKELWIAAKSGAGRAISFDPTDLSSTSSTSDWIFPMYPEADGPPVSNVTINPNDPSFVFAGNNAGRVYKTTTGTSSSPTWTKVFQAEDYTSIFGSTRPDHTEITSIAFVPSTCNRIYLAGKNWETETGGGIFYSDDDGATWTADTINSTGASIDFPVNTLWVTDNEVWAGVGGEGSTETGLRWRLSVCSSNSFWTPTTGTNIDNEIVTSIDGTTISGDVTIYISTQGGLYRGDKTSGSSTWTWQTITPSSASSLDFTTVTVNPSDADNAYAATGNCIYETTDGGSNWSVFGSSCSSDHEDVKVLKYDDIMAGTAIGVFAYILENTTATPAPTARATVTPVPTPGVCKPEFIEVSPSNTILEKRQSEEITVTITGENDCPIEGETVIAIVHRKNNSLLRALPRKQKTNSNGQASFLVSAKNKTGTGVVMFVAGKLTEVAIVNVAQ